MDKFNSDWIKGFIKLYYHKVSFYFWLKRKLGIPENCYIPWWFFVIKLILFPISTIKYYFNKHFYFFNIKIDYERECFCFNGKRVSAESIFILINEKGEKDE